MTEIPSPPGLTRQCLWDQRSIQLVGDGAEQVLDAVDELHNEARRLNDEARRSKHRQADHFRTFDAGVSAAVQVLRGNLTAEQALRQYRPRRAMDLGSVVSLLESRAEFLRNCNDVQANKMDLAKAQEIDNLVETILLQAAQ